MNTCAVPIAHQKKKYCFENLIRFVECDETLLTPALKGTRTKAEKELCGFYGYLPVEFPLHYKAFRNVHDAELSANHHVSPRFNMNGTGFINFIIEVGPVPSNLQNPILVRSNPDLGFIPGNLKWENAKKFRPLSARRALAIANKNR